MARYYSNKNSGHMGHRASKYSTTIAQLLHKIGITTNSRDAVLNGVVCQQMGNPMMGHRVSVRVGHLPGNEDAATEEAAVIAKFLTEKGYRVSQNEHIVTVEMGS